MPVVFFFLFFPSSFSSSSSSVPQQPNVEPRPADYKTSTLVYPLFFFSKFLYSVSYWNPPLLPQFTFLGAIVKLRKEISSFVAYVCPYAWQNSAPTGQIFIQYDISVFFEILTFMWPCIVKLGKVIIQLDATHVNPTPPWFTYDHTMKLHHNTHHHNTKPHGFYFVTVLHLICGSSLLCTPDDWHIDARIMLRWLNFIVASSWITALPNNHMPLFKNCYMFRP
jgi:hypothetical protein